ncbi:MAG TPA: DedA family protein [Candidatus Paceibacterota bacterium]|nr:DedA family protein [Candidatus Paceibacterota bacterium]
MIIPYIVLFFTMMFLGEEAMLVAGSLSSLGVLRPDLAFVFSLLGVYTGDAFWFSIGWYLGNGFVKKFGKFFFVTAERFQKMQSLFNNNGKLVLFFSKFVFGFNHLIMAAAGASHMKIKKFAVCQLYTSLIWTAIFMSLGYAYSNFISSITKNVKIIGLCLLAFFILFMISENQIKKAAEKIFSFFSSKKD